MVGEDLSMFNVLMDLLSITPPEYQGSVRVETCSMAGDWRGGSPLEERHRRRETPKEDLERWFVCKSFFRNKCSHCLHALFPGGWAYI